MNPTPPLEEIADMSTATPDTRKWVMLIFTFFIAAIAGVVGGALLVCLFCLMISGNVDPQNTAHTDSIWTGAIVFGIMGLWIRADLLMNRGR